MFGRQYYSLVAGLREYTLDADVKGFDAAGIIDEIRTQLSSSDRKTLDLFYTYYDIENILAMRAARSRFSELGNFTREELAAQLDKPSALPQFVTKILYVYDNPESVEAQSADLTVPLERALFAAYYAQCAKSKCGFLVRWSSFDRTLRNIIAALTARSKGIPVADVIVGGGDTAEALSRSSASDFGLRAEIDYMDAVLSAVGDDANLLEKERKIDMIRWEKSEELTAFDYFDIDAILGYLVRVNIVYRWMALDAQTGRRMYEKLIGSLSAEDKIRNGAAEK
ncbi:MAG: DUF2764 domain-containing protein [Alistipes putredinis]|nr:MAG: DUF2764 domain-containing protein [Alistipes putredinis]